MKYTFTFETSEAGNVPKKKINNFLKQVIDGINGIDEKSPNKDDYSITENIKDDTINLYFNMDTKSSLLKYMMSGIFDAFITASGIKRNTVFDDVIDIHTIADAEEQWTPAEYANYVLKTFTNYNVPRFIKNESDDDFSISFDVSLKHEIYQNIKSIMRSMEDHLIQSEPICSLWVHDRGNHSLSVSINQDKLSEQGLKYISDTVFPVMRYLFGEDVDLSDISPNNVEPVELVEKIYDEDDNNEEPDKTDSDTFHVGSKSLVRHIEEFITELRPEPVNKENIDQIAMVYSNIDNDKDSYYRIIRILHYVLIGYTCIDNVREKSAYDYANGNISIDYIDNIPTVKLNGSCCKLDTLEVFKAMNEFLRMFAVYYSSNNILDKFDELIDAGGYVQLYREFMQLYRTGIKRIAYSIDETTEFESCYSRMLSNLLYITAYPEYRERIKNDLVLSKMNESNDNTKEGQSSKTFRRVCDQEDNASVIEQLDEVFNDVSNDEESDTLSDDSAVKPEKVDEPANKPTEETKELLDPSIVTKLPYPDDFDNFISEVFQNLINSNSSPIQLLSKLNNKYKANVSLASLMCACNQIRNTSTAVSTTHIAAILSMDMRNKEGNIDTPDPSVSLSADELRFICDELSYKYRSEIVDDVLNKFDTYVNTWEIGAISYVLINKLNGNYMGNFNSLQTDLLNYRSFFNIPTDEPTTPRVKRKRRKKVEE